MVYWNEKSWKNMVENLPMGVVHQLKQILELIDLIIELTESTFNVNGINHRLLENIILHSCLKNTF